MSNGDMLFSQICNAPGGKSGKWSVDGLKVEIIGHKNTKLTGTYFKAPNAKRILLLLPSYGKTATECYDGCISALTEAGNSVLAVNLRGHDGSAGKFFTYGSYERHDVICWTNYIEESLNAEKQLPVYLFGRGIGGTIAILAGGLKLPATVKGIVARNPWKSPEEAVKALVKTKNYSDKDYDALEWYCINEKDFSFYEANIEDAFKTIQRPVLVLEAPKAPGKPMLDIDIFAETCPTEVARVDVSAVKCKDALLDFCEAHDNDEQSGEVKINYPELTMYQMIERIATRLPKDNALELMGKYITFEELLRRIQQTGNAFKANGIGPGKTVTLCMPNIPQALECLYGLDMIGATTSLIHPMSAEKEIIHYLTLSKSCAIVVPDLFYEKVERAVAELPERIPIIVVRVQTNFPLYLKAGFGLTQGRKFLKFPNKDGAVLYTDYIKKGKGKPVQAYPFDKNHPSAILYSGGTTGLAKGIELSSADFNATAMQATVAIESTLSKGTRFLSAMPVFHGFGLGIGIHTILINGACCYLMPSFNTKTYAEAMLKKKPNYIAGVPTIFKMLITCDELKDADLSYLRGMFVGGDSIPVPLKMDVDAFLKAHKAEIQVREGYGLTECVTASCLTPKDTYKPGSIGLPFPDTEYAIVEPGTQNVLPANEKGEIILTGPSLMIGYLDNPEATAETLQMHEDDRIWLHTGDLGHMDEDGYVFFHQRLKRMIVTSGYNVSPAAVEAAIDDVECVLQSCVIGVQDDYKMQRIKAFVVLKPGFEPSDEIKEEIMAACKKAVAGYALPREIEFREDLPKTLVGKVAFHVLEEEENAKVEAAKKAAEGEK